MGRKPRSADVVVEETPFRRLASTFWLLCEGPKAPTVRFGANVPAAAQGSVSLRRLRALLLDEDLAGDARNRLLGAVVARAQGGEPAWVVAVAGLLLPGLSAAARPWARRFPDQLADIEAEMLAGLLAAMREVDPGASGLAGRLVWAARRAAEPVVREAVAARGRATLRVAHSAPPPLPFGHPELVLAEAVSRGVISAENAELIAATRLDEMSLVEAADRWGISYGSANQRRYRAEAALLRWLNRPFAEKRGKSVRAMSDSGAKSGF